MSRTRHIASLRAAVQAADTTRMSTLALAYALLATAKDQTSGQIYVPELQQRCAAAIKHNDIFALFTAMAALYDYQHKLVSGETLAQAVQLLISHELAAGGPYRAGNMLAANAAVGHFMQIMDAPLPNVASYLEATLTTASSAGNGLSIEAAAYHLAPMKELTCLADWATAQADDTDIPCHFLALSYLLHRQERTPEIGLSQKLNRWIEDQSVGQDPLTNSIALLVLDQRHTDTRHSSRMQRDIQAVAHIARGKYRDYPVLLRSQLDDALQRILEADATSEITLLASHIAQSLSGGRSRTAQMLGAANIFCWIAYTAYDHVLDDAREAARAIPLANCSLRLSYDIYTKCAPEAVDIIRSTFVCMDAANTWELQNARFAVRDDTLCVEALPQYKDRDILADRSSGHILGPLLAVRLGQRHTSESQYRYVSEGLRHYLIARQLNDDIHDWQEDLSGGQISWVLADMLEQLDVAPGRYSINDLSKQLKTYFWERGIIRHTDVILQHTAYAQAALVRGGLLPACNHLSELLERLEKAAAAAADQQKQTHTFAAGYRSLRKAADKQK